jgi:hypothetical protein
VIELRRAGGVIPVASSPRICSPAPWEAGAGQARLAQLSRGGMTTLVLTNGERAEEGPKAQKIGLKSKRDRWSGAYPMASS